MVDKVFLTDKRRDVLAGESDLEGNSLAVSKSRIRKRARLALAELIEVAESDQIDSSDIFDPEDMAQLIHAAMAPAGGLTPRWNYDGTEQQYLEEYGYQRALSDRISHAVDGYQKMLTYDQHPSQHPTAGFDLD
jgi:hypothetical protein